MLMQVVCYAHAGGMLRSYAGDMLRSCRWYATLLYLLCWWYAMLLCWRYSMLLCWWYAMIIMRSSGSIHLFVRTVLENKRSLPKGGTVFNAIVYGSCNGRQPVLCSLRYTAQDGEDTDTGAYDIFAKVRMPVYFLLCTDFTRAGGCVQAVHAYSKFGTRLAVRFAHQKSISSPSAPFSASIAILRLVNLSSSSFPDKGIKVWPIVLCLRDGFVITDFSLGSACLDLAPVFQMFVRAQVKQCPSWCCLTGSSLVVSVQPLDPLFLK